MKIQIPYKMTLAQYKSEIDWMKRQKLLQGKGRSKSYKFSKATNRRITKSKHDLWNKLKLMGRKRNGNKI